MKKTVALVVVAVLAAISIVVVLRGRAELATGDEAMKRGAVTEALRDYEAAARWYLPGAPHVDTAYDRLRDATKDPKTALLAWRAIRSAATATRTLWQPHKADLEDATTALVRLEASDANTGDGAGADRQGYYRARFYEDVRADRGMAILAGFGVILLIAGVIAVLRGTRKIPVLGLVVVGMACWLVGLYNA
ncbi:MAG: hypothetical protein QM831_09710 [Kofleriaceae bacterium]